MIVETEGIGSTKGTRIGKMEVEDAQLKSWKSGKMYVQYLYKDMLQQLARRMHQNVDAHYDNFIVVSGKEGSGKSNLAYQICKAYDPDFQISTGYVYNMTELKEKILKGDLKGSIIWLDEGIVIADKRDWNSDQNKDFVKFLMTMRSLNISFVLCIPSWQSLDVYIRNNRIRYLCECKPMSWPHAGVRQRGFFELKTGDNHSIGFGAYGQIPAELADEYEARKTQSQRRLIDEMYGEKQTEEKKQDRLNKEYRDRRNAMLILHEKGVSLDDLREAYGYSSNKKVTEAIGKARKERQEMSG